MTRRSSMRSLPRTSVGKNGLIFCHCSSLSQNKLLLMMIPCSLSAENQYPIQPSTLLLSCDPSPFSAHARAQTLARAALKDAAFKAELAALRQKVIVRRKVDPRRMLAPLAPVFYKLELEANKLLSRSAS